MMDTDAVVLEDVYPYLKTPPLANHTLMFHSEDHLDISLQCGKSSFYYYNKQLECVTRIAPWLP
jgi:hypothetical protein